MSEQETVFVVPAEGASVRDPRTRELVPAEGLAVPAGDPHWMALVRFGDLAIATAPGAPAAPPPGQAKPAPAAKRAQEQSSGFAVLAEQ